ncbi:sigma-54 dependent transcriptional regulator [Pseudoalteromonas sp.]|uniref:sigma-54-dependent transcriptional regulator n=1 Tax=Pseudoalteromonas sp. TaxID=53249 RepID=UPI001BCBAEDD|nr:sigma-54 dependent transcriptional regulator [Pseudoalteromonas sp.]
MQTPLVYIVEDSIAAGSMYKAYLESHDYRCELFIDGYSAIAAIKEKSPDIIVQDVCLPDISGIEVLKFAKKINSNTQVIVITSNSSIDIAVSAMREGGYDFIEKPFENSYLLSAVASASKQSLAPVAPKKKLSSQQAKTDVQFDFIGDSIAVQTVKRILNSAKNSKASVFVTGESGTGKEVCAQYLHEYSNRKNQRFIAINCAAIPTDLFESEFFGHVKGAFSGALIDRVGAVEAADGGTLFLDEVCEMEAPLQAKLLRFLQTGCYSKIGSSDVKYSDVRIVCATNRNPQKEVAESRFREDLFYRLNVIPINLPPLREREDDILNLANFFIRQKSLSASKEFKSLSPEAAKAFVSYDWPGNIRELQNVIENSVVMNEGEVIELNMLTQFNDQKISTKCEKYPVHDQEIAFFSDQILPLWQVEKQAIESAIIYCDGNIPLAAVKLGVSASTLYRKIKSWEN